MTTSIIVEMRPRLQACNVFIISKENIDSHETVTINIKSTTVEIEWPSSKAMKQQISIPGYVFLPNSLSALEVNSNSITFRLQTQPVTNIAGSFTTEILPTKEISYVPFKSIPSIIANKPCNITCRCCGNATLREESVFARILPLPSASWEHGDWFCHRHSDSTDSVETKPKMSDCLYGTCFISVPLSLTRFNSKGVAHCQRCLSWLGTSDANYVKLWNCTVLSGGDAKLCSAIKDFVIVVKEAIHDSIGMLCRLITETKVSNEETHYLLLWVMDKDLTVLVDTADEISSVDKWASTCKLQSKQTIKVMYIHQTECSPMVQSWQSDVNVQSIDVAKPMLSAGLKYLLDHTQFLPPAQRTANGYFVSYLGL